MVSTTERPVLACVRRTSVVLGGALIACLNDPPEAMRQ
jgi:hypothetical protein